MSRWAVTTLISLIPVAATCLLGLILVDLREALVTGALAAAPVVILGVLARGLCGMASMEATLRGLVIGLGVRILGLVALILLFKANGTEHLAAAAVSATACVVLGVLLEAVMITRETTDQPGQHGQHGQHGRMTSA